MLDYRFPEPPMLTHPRKLTQGEQAYKQIMDTVNAAAADQTQLVEQFGLDGVLRMLAVYCIGQSVKPADYATQSVWRVVSQRLDDLSEYRFVKAISEGVIR